jgi:hypothetical protein
MRAKNFVYFKAVKKFLRLQIAFTAGPELAERRTLPKKYRKNQKNRVSFCGVLGT